MQRYGEDEVRRCIRLVADKYYTAVPGSIGNQFWEMEFVTFEKYGDKAVITINRPEDLNALNEIVVKQLDEQFSMAENDDDIRQIFITGAGKAFVAGADIKFFVKNMKNQTLDNIVRFTEYGQRVYEKIDQSPKQVIALINGIALGGGLELALCADLILAIPKAVMAFPETGIGIYPALGGTQRCTRRVGKGLAKYLITTGRMTTTRDALAMHLIDGVITQKELFEIIGGDIPVPKPIHGELPAQWQALSELYAHNSVEAIMSGHPVDGNGEEVSKLSKIMSTRAPIALRIAEQLIEEGKGCASELTHLNAIFSTSDALLGLTSIGKRVAFEGK